MSDLREIGPTCYFAPPRVFESLLTSVMIRMEDAGALKQKMFHHFMAVANVAAPTFSTASRSASATACNTGSATCWSMVRCAMCSA